MSRKRIKSLLIHIVLICGVVIILFPIYMALVAASHNSAEFVSSQIPILPGTEAWTNFKATLSGGAEVYGGQSITAMFINSLIMALCIAIGKVSVSIISAFAVVYFKFPGRRFLFWLILATIILPVEVRILSTFQVVAELNMINSYTGLTLPLVASATATFLFRQFFMTIPQSLVDAARIDGAGPIRFFMDILLPLSKSNILALFIIMFIYGWNQYLWPLVVTTQSEMNTIVMGLQQLTSVVDQIPQWNMIMAIALLAMLPPVLVVIIMQKLFEKGLLAADH